MGRDLRPDEISDLIRAVAAGEVWIPDHAPFDTSVRNRLAGIVEHFETKWWRGAIASKTASAVPWSADHHLIARSLAALFLENEELRKAVTPFGIAVAGLHLDGDVDLYNALKHVPIRLVGCRIDGRVILRHAETRTIDLRGSTLTRVDARRVRIKGDMLLTGICARQGVVMDRAVLDGRVDLCCSILTKEDPHGVLAEEYSDSRDIPVIAARFDTARIGQDLTIEDAELNGALVLDNTDIGSFLQIASTTIKGARPTKSASSVSASSVSASSVSASSVSASSVDATAPSREDSAAWDGFAIRGYNLRVAGDMHWSHLEVQGQIRLPSLHAQGSVELNDVTICGSKGRSLLLDFSVIGGDLHFRSTTTYGCIRMRKASVNGDVVFSPNAVEASGGAAPTPVRMQAGYGDRIDTPEEAIISDQIKGYALRMAGARIDGDLRMVGIPESPMIVNGSIDAANVHIGRKLRIAVAEFRRTLLSFAFHAPFMKVGADARFIAVYLKGTVDLEDAAIEGTLAFLSFNQAFLDFAGFKETAVLKIEADNGQALLLRRAKIGGNLLIDSCDYSRMVASQDDQKAGSQRRRSFNPFEITGGVYLSSAHVIGEIILGHGKIESKKGGMAVAARTSVVGRGLTIERGFHAVGEIRFVEARILDDILVHRATFAVRPSHLLAHPWALRLDRATVDGSVVIGTEPEDDPNVEDGAIVEGIDPYTEEIPKYQCVSYGGISLTGMTIDGKLAIGRTQIICMDVLDKSINFFENQQMDARISADVRGTCLEASLLTVSKDLRLGHSNTFFAGTVNLSGATFRGSAVFRDSFIYSPYSPEPGQNWPANALLCARMEVGLDLEIARCRIIGGADLTQVTVGGTGDVSNSVFVATEIATAAAKKNKREYDLNDVDAREITLQALSARFGRSLKLRDTVQAYGVVDIRATVIGNDLEFWLKTLRKPRDAVAGFNQWVNDKADIKASVDRFECRLQKIPDEDGIVREPSLFTGQRSSVGGTFYLGFSSDPLAPPSNMQDTNNHGGYLNFANMHVGTLRDSWSSWPLPGRLDIRGFIYNRFDHESPGQDGSSVPLTVADRLAWVRIATTERRFWLGQEPDDTPRRGPRGSLPPSRGYQAKDLQAIDLIFDQLSFVFHRMGLTREAEEIDQKKRRRILFRQPKHFGRFIWRNMNERRRFEETDHEEGSPLQSIYFRILSPILYNEVTRLIFVLMDWLWYIVTYPIRCLGFLFYDFLLRYGYRPVRIIPVLISWFVIGMVLTYTADDFREKKEGVTLVHGFRYDVSYSCIVPADDGFYYNFVTRSLQRQADERMSGRSADESHAKDLAAVLLADATRMGGYPVIPNYPRKNLWLYTLDSLVPFDLGMDRYWIMSAREECRVRPVAGLVEAVGRVDGWIATLAQGARDEDTARATLSDGAGPLAGLHAWASRVSDDLLRWQVSFRALHTLYIAIGYILVGIATVAASGLLRPNVKSPYLQKQDD